MTIKTARVQRLEPGRLQSIAPVWILVLGCIGAGRTAIAQTLAPRNPRELLELHGIEARRLDSFQDGEPLGSTDEETLIRIMQRFPRFPRHALERWSQPKVVDWSMIASAPADHRVAVFRLSGRVLKVERSLLSQEMASRLEFIEYFRVTLQLQESNQTAIICTRNVPQTWQAGRPIDGRAAALAIFLKTGTRRDDTSQLVFVAERVAWFPERENTADNIASAHVYLARLGFDVGLFDAVRTENKKPLTAADRECFYQLLAAARAAERSEFITRSQQPLAIVPLLRDPTAHHGELVVLEGIARRAIKVRVDDPDVRERFGIDHYYQIDLFVDLNKQVIKLVKDHSGKGPAIFENSFPVTVCVPSLPVDLHEGDTLRENVRVHAAFFKLWTYSSEFISSFNKGLLQMSPIMIGIEPRVIQPVVFNTRIGYALAVVTGLSLVGIWFGLRRQSRRVLVPRGSSPEVEDQGDTAKSEDDTGLPNRPDFTNLS